MTQTVIVDEYRVPDTITPGLDAPDQAPAFTAWLNTVPSGPGPLYRADGSIFPARFKNRVIIDKPYRLDTTLRPNGKGELEFAFRDDGSWNRVAWPMLTPQTVWNHCSFIDFLNPVINGSKLDGYTWQAKRESEHAMAFESCVGMYVKDARFSQVWGDDFWIGKHAGDPKWSSNIVIEGAVCRETGRDPVAITAAKNVTIRNCSFGPGRTCLDMEPNGASGGVADVLMEDCTFTGPYLLKFFSAVGGSTEGVVERVSILNNTGVNLALQAAVGGGERRADFTVVGNTGDRSIGNSVGVGDNRGCLMWFNGVQGEVVVTDNRNPVNKNRNMRIARFNDCPDVTYERNWPDQATEVIA